MRRIKRELKRAGAAAMARIKEPVPGVRVLLYHAVGPRSPRDELGLLVEPTRFREQLSWLAEAGVAVCSIGELVAGLRGEGSMPASGVVITFDDGYRWVAEEAWPVLKAMGFPAACFVTTGSLDEGAYWSRWPRLRLEEWAALDGEGFKVGAHGVSHKALKGLEESELMTELVESRRALESALGRPVQWLSYPHGAVDGAVCRAAEEAGFVAGLTSRPGAAALGTEPMAIPRIEISAYDTLKDFQRKVLGAYDWVGAWRSC